MIVAALASLAVMAAGPPLLLDSPPAMTTEPSSDRRRPDYVSISANGLILYRGVAISPEGLVQALKATPEGTDQRVYIRPDVEAPYGVLFHLMEVLRQGGFWRIGLIDTNDYSRAP